MDLMHSNTCIVRGTKRNKIACALQLHQVFESRQRCGKGSSEIIVLQIPAYVVRSQSQRLAISVKLIETVKHIVHLALLSYQLHVELALAISSKTSS
jgi:hypothetical protein